MNQSPRTADLTRLHELCRALDDLEREYHEKTDRAPWWVILPHAASMLCVVLIFVILAVSVLTEPAYRYPILLVLCFAARELFRHLAELAERRFVGIKRRYETRIDRLSDRLSHFSPENEKGSA